MKRCCFFLFFLLEVMLLLVGPEIMASTCTYSRVNLQSPAVTTNSPPVSDSSSVQGKTITQEAVNESPPVPCTWNARIDSNNDGFTDMVTATPYPRVEYRMVMANASEVHLATAIAIVEALPTSSSLGISVVNSTDNRQVTELKQTANGSPPFQEKKQIDSNWPTINAAMNSLMDISCRETISATSDYVTAMNLSVMTSETPPILYYLAGNSQMKVHDETMFTQKTRTTAISRAGLSTNDIFGWSNFTRDTERGLRGAGLVTDERQFTWFPNTGYMASTSAFFIGNDVTRKLAPFALLVGGDSGLTRAWRYNGV